MTKKAEIINEVPVTEDLIQAWADEAEAGHTPQQLHAPRRGRPSMGSAPAAQLSVRFEKELLDLVKQNASQRHITPSEVVREAVRQYLHAS